MSARRHAVWNNPDAVLYHGTTRRHAESILKEGIDPSRGGPNTDFGLGFYTTTNRQQAELWAEVRAAESGGEPLVVQISIKRAALARLRNLSFVIPGDAFWSLVERCRDRNESDYQTGAHYDVVSGPVARRWWGSEAYLVFEGYDQVSFHGDHAKAMLNDSTSTRVEVLKL